MTRKRIAVSAVEVVLVALLAAAGTVAYYGSQLGERMLGQIRERTGLALESAAARVRLSSHLILTLDGPRLTLAGGTTVLARRAELQFSINRVLEGSGIPLYAILLDHPSVHLAAGASGGTPPVNQAAAAGLQKAIAEFSHYAKKLQVIEGEIDDASGRQLVNALDVAASRRRNEKSAWRIRFKMRGAAPPIAGLVVAGDIRAGGPSDGPGHMIAHGRFWFWDGVADGIELANGIVARAGYGGGIEAGLRSDGSIAASASMNLSGIELKGNRIKAPRNLGDFTADLAGVYSGERLELTRLALNQSGKPILAANAYVAGLDTDSPTLGVFLEGLTIDAGSAGGFVSSIRRLPESLTTIGMRGGTIYLDRVGLAAPVKEIRSGSSDLIRRLTLSARLDSVKLSPLSAELPAIDELDAQLVLANGVVRVTQGSMRAGASKLAQFSGRADFSGGFDDVKYELEGTGALEMREFYGPLVNRLGAAGERLRREVGRIAGGLIVEASVKGNWRASEPTPPAEYLVMLTPHDAEVEVTAVHRLMKLVSGQITLRPESLALDQLIVTAERGRATLNGGIRFDEKGPEFRELRIALDDFPAEEWLPLTQVGDTLRARGPVKGGLSINTDRSRGERQILKGQVRIGPGEIQLGFLRSPIVVNTAVVKLEGGGAELQMHGAKLEGYPLEMTIGVADFSNPSIRIDADAENLDLEVMKFVRMPWSAKSPIDFFGKMRTTGHVDARQGKLAKLNMSGLKTDFTRDREGWRVYNFEAEALQGRVKIELSGRAKDDWIHIKGHGAELDVGQVLELVKPGKSAVLRGKLYSDLDVWGNTDVDFFQTLAGTCSMIVRDGALDKFTLMSRMLGMIDLKNWLTAQVPDPRKAGIPFTALSADFSGMKGVFFTNNLLLDGPVMDVTASGSFDMGEGSLDMEVGMFPFQTVNWLIDKIPLIGKDLAGSGGVVAAYFHVRGPTDDLSVMPAPITSVAEIVKRTLGFPINMIRPNTIK
jgi:hypothetical protein